jgi:preprotein translocase subunit SecE
MNRIIEAFKGLYFTCKKFFKEVVREMKLVTWPNKHDIKEGTIVVICVSAVVGVFLWIVDLGFGRIIESLY